MHETFVRPLGEVERQAFYEDMKVVAQLFGPPASVLPGSFSDFQADQRERLESGEIVVPGAAREVAETVLRPPVPVALRPALEALGPLTVGLLPERAPAPEIGGRSPPTRSRRSHPRSSRAAPTTRSRSGSKRSRFGWQAMAPEPRLKASRARVLPSARCARSARTARAPPGARARAGGRRASSALPA
jgi:hypothetical protein